MGNLSIFTKTASNFFSKLIKPPEKFTPNGSQLIQNVGNDIGHSIFKQYEPKKWAISNSKVNENFRNLGVGKKMYGNIFKSIAKNKPEVKTLSSDYGRQLSPGGENIWNHFMNKTNFPITKDINAKGSLYTLDLDKLRKMNYR